MAYQAPNYTQIPNVLLDEHMADMKEAELKVTLAVARATIGWHKDEDTLSLSQLMERTGMSRQGVLNGIEKGTERGTILRTKIGSSYSYKLSVASQRSRPVNEVDQLLVNEVDTQKKVLKKVKESTTSFVGNSDDPEQQELLPSSSLSLEGTPERSEKQARSVDPLTAPLTETDRGIRDNVTTTTEDLKVSPPPEALCEDRQPTEHQQMFGKLCDIVGWDPNTLTKEGKGKVAQTLGVLKKAGYTHDDLSRFGKEVWVKDWRWQRNRQRPSLTDIRTEIGKLRASDLTQDKKREAVVIDMAAIFGEEYIRAARA